MGGLSEGEASAEGFAGTVTYTPTLDDTIAAYRLTSRPRVLRIVMVAVAFFAASWLLFLFVLQISAEFATLICFGVFAFYAVLVVLIRGVWLPARVKKIYRQQVNLQRKRTLRWNPEGLRAISENLDVTVRWAEFIKITQDKRTILMYQSVVLFQFVPKRVLTAEQLNSITSCLSRAREVG